MTSCTVRSAAAARTLLDAGAKPFAPAPHGTPLGHTAYLPSDVAEVLIKAGVPVDHPFDSDGRTPLWSAACNGNAGVVSVLLEAGADLRGMSALKCAQEARDSPRSRPPSPWRGTSPFVVDFDRVIGLLEHAPAKRKDR